MGSRRETPGAWAARKQELALVREFVRDARRYLRYSIPSGGAERFTSMDGMNLDAAATRLYHRIEKALTFPQPKQPFGARIAGPLRRALDNPAAEGTFFAAQVSSALEALATWNAAGEVDQEIAPFGDGAAHRLDSAAVAALFESRHSVRNFDRGRPVDRALIEEAVRLAGTAPSVCNRQSWHAYYFDDREDVRRLLAIHHGSAGFQSTVPGLFVLTADLRGFGDLRERNQGWIDGGLFSMSLLLALHGLGLGAISLNWSRSNASSDRLRAAAGIPEHDNIIMLVATGYPAPGYRVARSPRRPLAQILRIGMPPG